MHAPKTEDPLEDLALPALPPPEDEGLVGRTIRSTPWWSISTGAHVAVVLAIGFFWANSIPAEEVIVTAQTRKLVKPPEMKPPLDLPPADKVFPLKAENPDQAIVKNPDDQPLSDPSEDFLPMKQGDNLDAVSDKPFIKCKSFNDVIGAAGGPGSKYGKRPGGTGGNGTGCIGGKEPYDAVISALRWLARHQNADGSWTVTGYVGRCKQTCSPNPGMEEFDAGVTGLSLLAFLGAGFSHLSKDSYDGINFGDVVRKGLQWMMSQQDPEGCVGPRSVSKYMYNHAICALALNEAYGLTGSGLFKGNAQRAVDFIVAAQNPGKGWRYSHKCGDNDSSVTGWAAMALKSAEISQLDFPRTAYDGARAWFDEATEETYGRVGYTHKGTGKVFIPGKNEHYDHHETLTAIAVMSRIFIDKEKSDPRMKNGVALLLRDKPAWDGNQIDFYYWYSAALALFQFEGAKSANWASWNEPMKNALLKHQNLESSGCRSGSWEPVDRWSCEGGRVYATAINALTLEVYYRYANVFGSGR